VPQKENVLSLRVAIAVLIVGLLVGGVLLAVNHARNANVLTEPDGRRVLAVAQQMIDAANAHQIDRVQAMLWTKSTEYWMLSNMPKSAPLRYAAAKYREWNRLSIYRGKSGPPSSAIVVLAPPNSVAWHELLLASRASSKDEDYEKIKGSRYPAEIALVTVRDGADVKYVLPVIREEGQDWRPMCMPDNCRIADVAGLSSLPKVTIHY
jgi:hypothetical protein